MDLVIEPGVARLPALAATGPRGSLGGVAMADWARRCRTELGLAVGRPLVGTGHQTLLWHPGILAKYLVVDTLAARPGGPAAVQLVVDQHAGGFGRLEVPVRDDARRLGIATVVLTEDDADEVPMGWHPPFVPPPPPEAVVKRAALPSVAEGVRRIFAAVAAARGEPDAARQMAAALDSLMRPWVRPMPRVTSSALMATGLARSILERMATDPAACVRHYNDAVATAPEAGIGSLDAAGRAVELPVWVRGPGGRRVRATVADVRRFLDGDVEVALLPRALLLTALVRLGMCDLFIHGTGGAAYDVVMERWIERWLGAEPAPRAVVTATLRLPLGAAPASAAEVAAAATAARRLAHDPAAALSGSREPSDGKRSFLARIDAAPRRSEARREAFFEMHRHLESERGRRSADLRRAAEEAADAARRLAEANILDRRTWPFPLYPTEMIDALATEVRERVAAG